MKIMFQSGIIKSEYPELIPQLSRDQEIIYSLKHRDAPKGSDTLKVEVYMGGSGGEFFYKFIYGKSREQGFEQLGEPKNLSSRELTGILVN